MSSCSADDDVISTFGRFIEACYGLERWAGRALEAQHGLPHVWYELLLRLSRSADGQLMMSTLGGQLALTSGGVTRLVDRMAAAGLVERRPCPIDRRRTFAAITPAGQARLAEATLTHAANLRRAFAVLDDHDRVALDRMLGLLRTATIEGSRATGSESTDPGPCAVRQ